MKFMKDKKELIREIRNLEQRQHRLFKKHLCEDYRESFTYYGELFEAMDMIIYYKKVMLNIHEDNRYIFGEVNDLYFVENMEKYKKKLQKLLDKLTAHINLLIKI